MTILATDLIASKSPVGYTGSASTVAGAVGYTGSSGSAVKYTATIGTGGDTTLTVTHNLNSTTVMVFVKETASGVLVYPDIDITGVNTVDITFAIAPSVNFYTVMVFG